MESKRVGHDLVTEQQQEQERPTVDSTGNSTQYSIITCMEKNLKNNEYM